MPDTTARPPDRADRDIVLLGATGYTGRLTAAALLRQGTRPVLAGRDADRLAALGRDLGADLPVRVADVSRTGSVSDLLAPGDVLVTTVGPFARVGRPAVEAAIAAGSAYLDSTGEPPFIREVFDEHGPRAAGRGCGLLTAFGYDYVPGNLAGALALRDAVAAGGTPDRVDVGYFTSGGTLAGAASTGTLASAAGLLSAPSYSFRDGRLVGRRSAASVHSFDVLGTRREGVSVGGTEHFALPRFAPSLRTVEVYLGWAGPLSRAVQAWSALAAAAAATPGGRAVMDVNARVAGRLLPGPRGGGPDAAARARTGSLAVAVASAADGRPLADVTLAGPNPYELTADLLAFGARHAATVGLAGVGALGPVDAFGLDPLAAACARMGLHRV